MKYLGGVYPFLLRRNLKGKTVGDFVFVVVVVVFLSSGKSFQSRIVDVKKRIEEQIGVRSRVSYIVLASKVINGCFK